MQIVDQLVRFLIYCYNYETFERGLEYLGLVEIVLTNNVIRPYVLGDRLEMLHFEMLHKSVL